MGGSEDLDAQLRAAMFAHLSRVSAAHPDGAAVGPDLGPVTNPESVPMIVTGVRLSTAAVARLDELAGNDKAGRSG